MTRVSIGEFELDLPGCRLVRQGSEVPLEPRVMDMLRYLAARPGELVLKEQLIADVWQARVLSAGVLGNTAAKLRHALGQAAGERTPLETVRGRGYRLHVDAFITRAGNSASSSRAQASTEMASTSTPDERVHPAAALPRSAQLQARPWVGRASVLATMDGVLQRALAGQGQLIVLVGEAGIGKTRTLEEIEVRARAKGIGVWHGAAYDGGGAPPYWPWTEILRAAFRDLGPVGWARHVPSTCTALLRLMPELAAQESSQLDRFQLFDELTQLVGSASETSPRLLALDDLHWADDGTLELLAHAAQALACRSVVFVASLREEDLAPSIQAHAAFARLSRMGRRIELTGLCQHEISEWIEKLHGPEFAESDCAPLLAKRTQGNPFFIMQLLDLAVQRGVALNAASLRALEAPPAIRCLIGQRIASLDERVGSALSAAAVIGQTFDAPLLAQTLASSTSQVHTWLEPARQLGIVVQSSAERPDDYRFYHALVRECLYEQLSRSKAGGLHARLALLLEARVRAGDPRMVGELARHSLLAVPFDAERCLRACSDAASAARVAAGFATAARLLLQARAKLLVEGHHPEQLGEVALAAGTDQFFAGDIEGSWQTLVEGAAGVQRAGEAIDDRGLLSRFVVRMLDCVQAGAGDETSARAWLEEALRQLPEHAVSARTMLLAHQAEVAFELPFDERLAILDEADHLASSHGDVSAALEVAQCGVNLRNPTRPEPCLAAARRLRTLLREHPRAVPAGRSTAWLFSADLTEYVCALTAGDLGAADEVLARVSAADPTSRAVAFNFVAELMAAGRALGDGKLTQLSLSVSRMKQLASSIQGGVRNMWWYYSLRLEDARERRPALRLLLRGLRPERPAPRHNTTVVLTGAGMAVRMGFGIVARTLLARLSQEELQRMPSDYGDLGCLCDLAEVYHRFGDVRGARRLHAQLLPFAHANAVAPGLDYRGSVEHYLGLLAEVLGDREQARERLIRAEARNASLEMPLQVARTRAALTRLGGQRSA